MRNNFLLSMASGTIFAQTEVTGMLLEAVGCFVEEYSRILILVLNVCSALNTTDHVVLARFH
jgi:hypothetical protein